MMLPEEKLYYYKAHVTKVIDGDTVEALVEWRPGLTEKERLRFLIADTPEVNAKNPFLRGIAKEATAFIKDLLERQDIIIWTNSEDNFGRYLSTIWHENVNVNQLLLDKELAVVWGEEHEGLLNKK